MAIRRRRKTLTNLLSTMDRRVTSVELRPISLLTTAEVSAAVATPETLNPGPDTIVGGLTAPNQYRAVTEGYYYPARMTGSAPRVELYFTTRPGIIRNDTIRISGIYNLVDGSSAVGLALTGDFKTLSSDTPPWDDRPDYNGVRHTPGESILSAVLFDPTTGTEYSDRKSLIVKSRIASTEATTTTAKITFTSTNYFKVNDVVYVEMPQTSPYFGIDGLFRVKEVGSNFITFDFSSAIPSSLASASVTEERYVYAVAQAAVRDGATWIDTRGDVDTVYVWKDIRWVTYSTGDVTKDTLAPSPVTSLTATNENDTPDGNAIGLSRINLTWVAPTTNSDGTPLDDLIGYTIWWRQYETQDWSKTDITGNEITWSGTGFEQGANAYFRVFARDSGGNLSTGVGLTHSVNRTPPAISQPNLPIVTTYLGTIKVAYDDLTVSGAQQAGTAKEVEVYYSTNEEFTPGPGSYYGKFAAGNRSYIIIPGTELIDGIDYYIRIIVRDIYGNITAPSDPPVSIRAKLSKIVTFDMIEVGTLDGEIIIGTDIRTSENPSTTGGIILNKQQLIAYNDDGEQTFRIDAATGAVSIGEYLGKQEAAGLYLGQSDAATTYSTKIEADAIELKATNAAQSAADAQSTADESITRIEAGNITITKAGAVAALNQGVDPGNTTTINGGLIKTNTIDAQAISTGTLRSGVIYAGEISADKITSGSISADRLTTTSLNADNIKAGTISADRITTASLSAAKINATNIDSGTLTGRVVRTASSGKRVALDNSTNSIQFWNSSGNKVGQIDGTTSAGDVLEVRGPGTPGFTIGAASTNFAGSVLTNTAGGLSGNINAAGRVGQQVFSSLGTTTSAVHRGPSAVGGYFGPAASDERLKKDIVELQNSLDLINNLRPVKFRFKSEEDGPVSYGLIAQEVQPFFDNNDNVVNSYPVGENDEDQEEYLSIEYEALIAPLIGAIKELTQKNLELEARLADLENSQ